MNFDCFSVSFSSVEIKLELGYIRLRLAWLGLVLEKVRVSFMLRSLLMTLFNLCQGYSEF